MTCQRLTRGMLVAAAIGIEVEDAYYANVELRQAGQWVHGGEPGAKFQLSMILGSQCDDYAHPSLMTGSG